MIGRLSPGGVSACVFVDACVRVCARVYVLEESFSERTETNPRRRNKATVSVLYIEKNRNGKSKNTILGESGKNNSCARTRNFVRRGKRLPRHTLQVKTGLAECKKHLQVKAGDYSALLFPPLPPLTPQSTAVRCLSNLQSKWRKKAPFVPVREPPRYMHARMCAWRCRRLQTADCSTLLHQCMWPPKTTEIHTLEKKDIVVARVLQVGKIRPARSIKAD